jgi:hypothetical protein
LDIEDAEPLSDGGVASAAGTGGGRSAPLSPGGAPSAGAAAGESSGGEDSRAPTRCEQYCDVVAASCQGVFAVYTSRETCLAVCAALPEGEPDDDRGNSVECRLRAARYARDEAAHYCPIAGPGGNGHCGSNCEGLCRLRAGICAEFATTDEAACVADCKALPDLGDYSTDTSRAMYSGSHVQCRLYHVSAAPVTDTEQHCRHGDGAAPCN